MYIAPTQTTLTLTPQTHLTTATSPSAYATSQRVQQDHFHSTVHHTAHQARQK